MVSHHSSLFTSSSEISVQIPRESASGILLVFLVISYCILSGAPSKIPSEIRLQIPLPILQANLAAVFQGMLTRIISEFAAGKP